MARPEIDRLHVGIGAHLGGQAAGDQPAAIEHDMDIVFKIAPEIVVLCYGRILATGTPDAIRRNEAVIEAYLGTEHHTEAAI